MTTRFLLRLSAALVLALMPHTPAAARTLDMAFMPPAVEPQELCSTPVTVAEAGAAQEAH